MKVCVVGLWHLGTVTAACLASMGHDVVGLDFDEKTVTGLQSGTPPLFEPGLEQLIVNGLREDRLRFTNDIVNALKGVEVVWIAYDTPVDDEDSADVEFVVEKATRLFPFLRDGMMVLISSQVPVGTTRRLELEFAQVSSGKRIPFAYSPENLRLGTAIAIFSQPDRMIVGVRAESDRDRIRELVRPFSDRIMWMSVESAEMTKHAINAFLAISVTFANEIATICEQVGADAKQVEAGLKSEERIGPKAYVAPGAAFAGGTLARDIAFLTQISAVHGVPSYLLAAVKTSNDDHRLWVRRKLSAVLGSLKGKTVAIWGLTYKPGTDSLRRSSSVELATWLAGQGVQVMAYDPSLTVLPDELGRSMKLYSSSRAAASGAQALVVATEWPDFKEITADDVVSVMASPFVIDPARFLKNTLGSDGRIRYSSVGSS